MGTSNGNKGKTHCKRGHALAGDNVRVRPGANGRDQRQCKECARAAKRTTGNTREQYLATVRKTGQSSSKKRISARRRRRKRSENREAINALKQGRPCLDCGGVFHHECMEFDHRDGTDKKRCVSKFAHLSWESIVAEMAKCDLVCANCHRVRTFLRRKSGAQRAQSKQTSLPLIDPVEG